MDPKNSSKCFACAKHLRQLKEKRELLLKLLHEQPFFKLLGGDDCHVIPYLCQFESYKLQLKARGRLGGTKFDFST